MPDAVARAVSAASPDVIINCAAFNDVDGAEVASAGCVRGQRLRGAQSCAAAESAGASSCTTAPISSSTARADSALSEDVPAVAA